MDSDTASVPPLAPGQEIDGFRLEAPVHRGGMSELWSVSHPEHAGPLLMKLPRVGTGKDPAAIVGFEVEQLLLPVLGGVHVPRFVARGDFTRVPYLVMERIEGVSLYPRIEQAPLPLDEVVDIGARVANALHELHRQGLVHLDVKPSNIMTRPDGSIVLIDFGLAHHDSLPDLLDEEFRLPVGTAPYMSPEQLQFVRNDPRSDLFALGAMLYLFATGQRPFGAPDTLRGLRKRLYMDPLPPRKLREDCPPWLQEVILRCLEVKAEDRWQSAAQLAMALEYPEQVALTDRAERLTRAGGLTGMKRWLAGINTLPHPAPGETAVAQVMRSPIVMAAVDIVQATTGLLTQLREAVRRAVVTAPGARLACVSVMRAGAFNVEKLIDDEGRSVHVKQLVALKHWARPLTQLLGLDEARLTFHVLEAPDVAGAIVDFAERTHVDHIVMGARGRSALRRYLGSVSSEVVAKAPCTVTVVRE